MHYGAVVNGTSDETQDRWYRRFTAIGLAAVVVVCSTSSAVRAQTTANVATVQGIVFDSLSRTGLDRAVVQVVAANDHAKFIQSATTDSVGRFELSNIPVGSYSIGFVHPLLDSLGVVLPVRDFRVASNGSPNLTLAVPSSLTLRLATPACSGDSSAALVIGVVRDHESALPVEGATVRIEWIDVVLGSQGFRQALQQLNVLTANNGWYSICQLPSAGTIRLTATRGSETTDQIELQIPIERIIRRDLYLSASATGQNSVGANSTERVLPNLLPQTGRLAGTVRGVPSNRALAGAYVGIANGPNTHTNHKGEWVLTGAPSGTRMLEIRAVGYYPHRRAVDIVKSASPVHVELPTLKAILDTMRITAKRVQPDPHGFAWRRRIGGGHFLSPSDIARFPAVTTSDLFRTIPGVQMTLRDGQKYIQLRGTFEPWCSPAIFVDGHNMSFMSGDDIDDYVIPERVAGIEVYQGAVIPAQFQMGLKGCGSIVIWTQ